MKTRLNYSKIKVVDGDTMRILLNGEARYVRILGLDTDELGTMRGERQKRILERMTKRWWFKPKLYAETAKTRDNWPYFRHHNGRILAYVKIFRFWRYIDYHMYMIEAGQVKKGSRWNN